jgi:hypothetical protein
MKSAQWMAVLILALMVGGISFVSVYLGDRGPENADSTPTASSPSLRFPIKSFPREFAPDFVEKLQTTEVGQTGYQDYWFVNDSGQEVLVGLNGKGCTCSEVEITVAPPSWLPFLLSSAVVTALQQPPRGLDNLTVLAATCDRAYQFPELPKAETTVLTRELAATAKVPAGAVGRVRLSWHQDQVKPLRTYADLWMGQRGGNANARLETTVRISMPLEVNKELAIHAISERELEKMPKGLRGWIVCFSLTRPVFHIKAELLHDFPQAAQADPVEVGEPIPLSSADLRRLEKPETMQGLTALSGYRIPVTVRARAKDGTPMEWGRFHRVVQLSSPDPGIDPVQIQVTGEVVGEISIAGDEGGTINLGPFLRRHGIRRAINLETDERGIELELDTRRQPKFLNVELKGPLETSGHRSWVLEVEVPPNAARGEFPRSDNPDYRDSAIYVKTKDGKAGPSLRSIRIPVKGVANEG